MQNNKVEICGVDTSKLKVMKEDKKTELLRQVKQGNTAAREELINGNLKTDSLTLKPVEALEFQG